MFNNNNNFINFMIINFITHMQIWITSPKEKCFPETIPEESSSTEDEQVVSLKKT